MIKIQTAIFLVLFLLSACVDKNINEEEKSHLEKDTNSAFFILTDIKYAVIISPHEKTVASIKQTFSDTNDFYISVDDYLFYINQAREIFKKQNIMVIEKTTSDTIDFQISNCITESHIPTDNNWEILLFNGYDYHVVSKITDLETEIEKCKKVKY